MYKYVVTFSKMGSICYISHLDTMRLFKRSFKRAGIRLSYSQGFHPHPKMGFAQPLSLGYWGLKEWMEFETEEDYEPQRLQKAIAQMMPEGIRILGCSRFGGASRTLAAAVEAAEYLIAVPLKAPLSLSGDEIRASYLGRERIVALKKQKKKKGLVETDIKPMIRRILFTPEEKVLFVTALLDSGSTSNVSPELVISTLLEHLKIDTDRSEIEVMRKEIFFREEIKCN